jgi:hypothetical protein
LAGCSHFAPVKDLHRTRRKVLWLVEAIPCPPLVVVLADQMKQVSTSH